MRLTKAIPPAFDIDKITFFYKEIRGFDDGIGIFSVSGINFRLGFNIFLVSVMLSLTAHCCNV